MLVWAILLILQNAAFTWVSRSRNSTSIVEHAVASICSNALFIINLWFSVDYLRAAHDWVGRLSIAVFYITFTTSGAVLMHWKLLSRKL